MVFGYLFSTKDYLVFEVTVKNKGIDSVLVDPQNFSFQPMPFLDSATSATPIHAHSFKQIVKEQAHIGTVYFPRYDNAKQLLFNFKTAGQDFETMFRQTIELR